MSVLFSLLFVFACLRGTASEVTKNNLLFFFPDQWRQDWADDYYIPNLDVSTPTFESIVKKGTRFTNAIVGSPVCAPSRSCIAAGKVSHKPSPSSTPLPSQTIVRNMIIRGYGVIAMTCQKMKRQYTN